MGGLLSCTGQWGRSGVVRKLPFVRLYEDAIYIPWSSRGNTSWGLFDSLGSVIVEAQNTRDPDFRLSGPAMKYCAKAADEAYYDKVNTWIYGGILLRHFGHFIINSLPRFWPTLQKDCPPILCHFQGVRSDFEGSFAANILAPLGVSVASMVAPVSAVRIRKLYVPETALHEQMSINSVMEAMGRLIGNSLYSDGPDIDLVYFSKTRLPAGVGHFSGELAIEDKMRSMGALIVHPENIELSEQISIIRRSRLLTGTVGSALHSTLFAARPSKICAINPNNDVNSNFLLIDKLLGSDARYVHTLQIKSLKDDRFQTLHELERPEDVAVQFAINVREMM